MSNLIGFFVKRYVLAISIFTTIVFFGLVSSIGIGVDLLPNFELSFVTVNTSYPGAGSAEVAKQVSEPIEDALATLPGINSLSSLSFEGLSVVFVEFAASVNADQAAVDVSQRVNAIAGTLPEDATSPSIQKLDPNDEAILNVAISATGEDIRDIQSYAEEILEPELQKVVGVGDVSVIGPIEREIQVLLEPNKLELYSLSPQQIAGAINATSAEVPLGSLTVGGERILFAGRNKPETIQDVETMLIDPNRGLRVQDVAVVRDTSADITAYSRLNGKPVVILEVLKQSGANSVEVSSNVNAALKKLDLPEGFETSVIADTTPFITQTVNDTQGELVRAVFIVALIVLLFIGRVGSTVSVILAIPISFAGALIIFGIFGFTFNIVTLLAVTVAVGLVVDDSIVIAESIDRYREMGYGRLEAVKLGAGEVSVAVLASTLSLLAVFLPISFLPGILGQFFREFGLTLTATIVASYLEALFFLTVRLAYLPNPELPSWREAIKTPAKIVGDLRWILQLVRRRWLQLLAGIMGLVAGVGFIINFPRILERIQTSNPDFNLANPLETVIRISIGILIIPLATFIAAFAISLVFALIRFTIRLLSYTTGAILRFPFLVMDAFISWLREAYGRTLNRALSHANWVLGGAMLLFLSVFFIGPQLGFSFAPGSDSAQAEVIIEMPSGTDLATTNELASRVENILINKEEINALQVSVGVNTSDVGNISTSGRAEFFIELVSKGDRDKSDVQLGLQYAEEAKEALADFPEAKIVGGAVQNAGPPETSDYAITIAAGDLTLLKERDTLARLALEDVDYLGNINSDLDTSISERIFEIDSNKLVGSGLTVSVVFTTLRAYNVGIEATKLRENGSEFPVQVKIGRDDLRDEQALLSLPIISPFLSRSIPLGELGRFVVVEAPASITRTDQTYTTEIRADVLEGAPAASQITGEVKQVLVDAGVFDERVTEGQGTGLDLTGDLVVYTPLAFGLALILNYLVIASQFNSFIFPIYLLLTVPLALVGALWLFFLSGIPLDVNSVLGIVILTGLVTKNAILLLDIVVNRDENSEKQPLKTLLVNAGKLRLRPILMTTSTLVAISVPLLLGAGEGSEFRRPLGLVIFGGVTSSALLTLFVIPAAFYRFERKRFDEANDIKEEIEQQEQTGHVQGKSKIIPPNLAAGSTD